MKKSLIALAALASTAAFAQSSVTLYGVADGGVAKVTGKSFGFAANQNGNSRWGLRGTEDLGGGLKAGFNFEQGLSIADGTLAQSGNGPFGRMAFMNLTGEFGELRLGRTLNPSFYAAAAWELTGIANYGAAFGQFGGALGGIRNNNQIAYTTPNMGGFTSTIGFIAKGNDAGAAAGEQSKLDFNAVYANGPLVAALGYNKVQGEERNYHVGARYTLGTVLLAASYVDPAGKGKGFTAGATVPVGTASLTLDLARDTDYKDTNVLAELKYPLSKRTFAYTYLLRDGKGKAAANVNTVGLGMRHNF